MVEYQLPVNSCSFSVIDFRVTDLKSGGSRLVEVTETPRRRLCNSESKIRQIRNLRENGEPFVILTGENLSSINGRFKFK